MRMRTSFCNDPMSSSFVSAISHGKVAHSRLALIQHLNKFREHPEAFLFGVEFPRFKLRIQRLQANPLMRPGSIGPLRLSADVSFYRVAVVQAAAQVFDQHQLTLAGSRNTGAEHAQAAIRD